MKHLLTLPCVLLALASLTVAFAQPTFAPGVSTIVGSQPDGLALLDANRDGLQDIAVAVDGPDRLQFLLQGPGNTWALGPTLFLGAGTSPQDVEAIDIDGDNDLDLAIALANSNQVLIVRNDGPNVFSIAQMISVGNEPREIAVLDIDGDLDMDLAVSARSSNDVTILRNTGGSFAVAQVIAAGNEPRDLTSGDLNGDGLRDLVVAIHDDRRVLILAGGAAGFTAAGFVGTPFNEKPSGVALGDFDGDGDLDLAVTAGNGTTGPNFVAIHTNLGALLFSAGAVTNLPIEPGTVAAADFDADNAVDLAIAGEGGSAVMVLENLGAGSFALPQVLAAGLRPDALRVGDVDADGDLDIVSGNRDANSVTVFSNTSAIVPPMNPLSVTALNGTRLGTIANFRLAAPGEAGAPFVTAWSSQTAPGLVLPDGRVMPLAFDFLFLTSLNANNGFFGPIIGNLNAMGEATSTFTIPNFAPLRGLSLYTAFITGDVMGRIVSISPALRVTIN